MSRDVKCRAKVLSQCRLHGVGGPAKVAEKAAASLRGINSGLDLASDAELGKRLVVVRETVEALRTVSDGLVGQGKRLNNPTWESFDEAFEGDMLAAREERADVTRQVWDLQSAAAAAESYLSEEAANRRLSVGKISGSLVGDKRVLGAVRSYNGLIASLVASGRVNHPVSREQVLAARRALLGDIEQSLRAADDVTPVSSLKFEEFSGKLMEAPADRVVQL